MPITSAGTPRIGVVGADEAQSGVTHNAVVNTRALARYLGSNVVLSQPTGRAAGCLDHEERERAVKLAETDKAGHSSTATVTEMFLA
jgi:hypothetical protein